MKKGIYSEQEVKDALNIDSFRNLSKDKIMEFTSLIPHMDKDVAIEAISQFPSFSEMSIELVKELSNICDKAFESNNQAQLESINAYKLILNALNNEISKDNLSVKEKLDISKEMVEVADKINKINADNKKFLLEIIKYTAWGIGTLSIVGVSVLGVRTNNCKLPKLSKTKLA